MNDKMCTLPLLPLKITLYPNVTVNVDIANRAHIRMLKSVSDGDGIVFASCRIEGEDSGEYDNVYRVGVTARVGQIIAKPDGSVMVMISGLERAIARSSRTERGMNVVTAEIIDDVYDSEAHEKNEAYIRELMRHMYDYFRLAPHMGAEQFISVINVNSLPELTNVVAGTLAVSDEVKQMVLETFDVYNRTELILTILKKELEIMNYAHDVDERVNERMEHNQREYYLHEQMKLIREELGESDAIDDDAEEFRKRIDEIGFKDKDREMLLREVKRFENMQPASGESNVIRMYLETVLELPWNEKSEETLDIAKAEQILNEDHYGLTDVKERILEHLAVRQFTGGMGTSILCLVGPPGVGKTSVAKSVARALGREYVRISLGGVHDEADIRGHRKTYLGSMPGRIIDAVKRAGVNNPLILLDEIDKVGSDYRGDPQAALLEVLDYEQNSKFRDHYIELEFDLSNVMFITTANTTETVSAPLLDRMEIITLPGYTSEEKFNIAKTHLLPKVLKRNGMKKSVVTVTDGAIREMIDGYTREAGVRKLEQSIDKAVRKAAKMLLTEERKSVRISEKNISKFLGRRKVIPDTISEQDEIGVVRGLAWTAMGGETLSVEANVMDGSGKLELTGQLGNVMKESARAAIGYIRSRADTLEIDRDFYKTKDIHIHVPEGAVPKDGPSAGITMATAVVSSLTERAVRRDVAMTGEITLRGRVLPIGGLKEKSIAAYRAGVKTVIIPEDNRADLEDIPEEIRNKMEFVPVRNMDKVLQTALN